MLLLNEWICAALCVEKVRMWIWGERKEQNWNKNSFFCVFRRTITICSMPFCCFMPFQEVDFCTINRAHSFNYLLAGRRVNGVWDHCWSEKWICLPFSYSFLSLNKESGGKMIIRRNMKKRGERKKCVKNADWKKRGRCAVHDKSHIKNHLPKQWNQGKKSLLWFMCARLLFLYFFSFPFLQQ